MSTLDQLNDSFISCSTSDDDFLSAHSYSSVDSAVNDDVSSVFSNYPNNLNVVHINAQSIPAHYPDLLATFTNENIDAILVSESFLKPSLPSLQFSLPGYILIRNDRTGKGGGGVAVYLRSNICYKIISCSPSAYNESAEYMILEITRNFSKILLIVLYSPSLHIDYFNLLENLLHDYCPLYRDIIILGDFNTCILKSDTRANKLLNILSSFNLHLLPLSATHKSPNCTPSLLDLIIVSMPSNVNIHGQFPSCFSYHDLIYLSYNIRSPKKKAEYSFRRSLNKIDNDALLNDACALNWCSVFSCDSVDEAVSNFNTCIINLYDRHAPLKKIRIKHNPSPWLTDSIKCAMMARNRARKRFQKHPSDDYFLQYKLLRNKCNKLCRTAKRRYIHDTIASSNSQEMWRFLKSLGIGKDPVTINSYVDINVLNSHFTTPPSSVDVNTKADTLNYLASIVRPSCSFSFLPVTEAEVDKHVRAITSTAVGNDNLCSKMFFPILPHILPVLQYIFNLSLRSNTFPTLWKSAKVIPLPKNSNPTTFTDYRPISILPFLSKVLEHIVHSQLSEFLRLNNLLSPYQSGFRPGHSTVTALVKVTDDIRMAMDSKCLTVLVLLDFSSAFNSVDYDLLIGVLSSLNFSPSALSWFDSYLRGRSQYVFLNDVRSNWCNIVAGVPQGCVLSPLVFSLFINTVTSIITSNFHLYADDLQLYRHFSIVDATKALDLLNKDLAAINTWANSFGLLVNPHKSKAIILGSRQMLQKIDNSTLPPIVYNGTHIPFSSNVTNLGVIFSSDLSWERHINFISKKMYYTFHSLNLLKNFLPIKTKITLVQTLILPILDYADTCFLDATEVLLNKLERLLNSCIRFIFGLRKYDHVSAFRAQLKWLPIRFRRNSHILCLLFSILHNPAAPNYLRDRFSYLHSSESPCRSNLSTVLRFPVSHSQTYSWSFTVHAVSLWNSLPPGLRSSPSLPVFKKHLKEYYLKLT